LEESSVKAYDAAVRRNVERADPITARFFRITFPERGKIILNIGPGDHTAERWELNKDQLRCLVLDAIPELLR
jgi:hypothetical protein